MGTILPSENPVLQEEVTEEVQEELKPIIQEKSNDSKE